MHACFHEEVDSRKMLDAFIRIQNAQGVLRFAQKYGALSICEPHSLYGCEAQGCTSAARIKETVDIPGHEAKGYVFAEPLSTGWSSYVAAFRACLSIAAALRTGNSASAADWHKLAKLAELKDVFQDQSLRTPAQRLAAVVNTWTRTGNCAPQLVVSDQLENAPLIFDGDGFSTLAFQLALAVRGGELALCSACSIPYLRKRLPQTGRNNYCPECGERAASRIRRRRWADRHRDKARRSSREEKERKHEQQARQQ